MDLNGGNNPSSPRLDSNPVPQQSAAQAPSQQVFAPQPAVTAPVIQTPVMPPQPATQTQAQQQPSAAPDLLADSGITLSSDPSGPVAGKGKTIILIAVGSVLVLALVAGAFFVGNVSGKSAGRKIADAEYQKKEADRQRQEAEKDAEQEKDAELDLGTELVEPKYADENVEGDIGKQLTASDGLVLKVTNIERNFKTDDPNYKLDPTKELVKVNFLMGNIAKDKAKDITNFAFYLEDSGNARLTPQTIASYTDKFDTIKLDPGAQAKGSIVYLVNKDEVPLKFVREQRYRFAGENREVTTKTIINVAE
ncbi:MAG: DUF4352 domain-containing protein [Candidatus Saccharimonadales bacterium]